MIDGPTNQTEVGGNKLSRNVFLKVVGAAFTGVGLGCLASSPARKFMEWFLQTPKTDKTPTPLVTKPPVITATPLETHVPIPQEFPPDLVFKGEAHQYNGDSETIIEGVKKDFGISIISPTTWGEKNEPNLKWDTRSIALIAEAISQLPPEYRSSNRSPREILLMRSPGSTSEGAGGGYNGRSIILFISETFAPDEFLHGEAGRLYGYQRDHLRATVTHESTHSFCEAYPELLKTWIQQTGWVQEIDGKWINRDQTTLIHDGGADANPGEDLAVSAGLMHVQSSSLSKNRATFFLTNDHFASWPTITTYKINHP